MGICVVNKSWIAVLAGPEKYEILPVRAGLHQSASINRDRPCHFIKASKPETVNVWSVSYKTEIGVC